MHLTAPPAVIRERLRARHGHFMPPALLASQLGTLEEPAGALSVDVTAPPADSVAAIRRGLGV